MLLDQNFILTVHEVLQRPLFEHAVVMAGEGGLNRRVRWVHILEVLEFDQLIHGEELILTTGINLHTNPAVAVEFVEHLVKKNVSCLCIELGYYFADIPQELIEAANGLHFPLIVFNRSTRFVDITQDLHVLLINRHYKLLQDLESISRKFHRLTLTSQGIPSVLKLLHSSTKAQIIYQSLDGPATLIPVIPEKERKGMLDFLSSCLQSAAEQLANGTPQQWVYQDRTMIAQSVGSLGKTWAYVVLVLDPPQQPQEYDYLILDSACLSIAQDLLRKRYMDERKLYTENLWVDDLVHMRIKDEEQIQSIMGSDFKKANESNYHVCLVEFENVEERSESIDSDHESMGIHLSLVLRSVYQQHGFHPLITIKNNRLIIIAIDSLPKSPAKKRLLQVFEAFFHMKDENLERAVKIIGIGKPYKGLIQAHSSYQEAIQAIMLYPAFHKKILLFEELGVFQLLFHIENQNSLHAYVRNYLGPLIEHDAAKGSELLRTLDVYLDNDSSKQATAHKLFIVRQTLYYRLEKIAELLGPDYMAPENKLAIQVALRAYQLLYPEKTSE
ncbi:MAG: hypothetical protein A2189_05880 [Paenibacillus sp. RIFOXYA1_FULL_44_5]|nr:MAG: hypothetical protein A2189_05880 [Paenibacillus sp. RIFOXYA1_FULL_44_5]